MKRSTIAAGILASASTALAAPPPIALVGGTVHPVSAAAIADATVLIRGEQIAAVGRDLPLPAGATVIDCTGKVVTPGLIDSVSQLGLVEIWLETSTNDSSIAWPDPVRAAIDAQDALDPRSPLVGVARRHGVTSVVASPTGGLISGRAAWLDLIDGSSRRWPQAVSGPVAMVANFGEGGARAIGSSRAAAMMRLREVLDDARTYRNDRVAHKRNALRKLSASRLDLEALDAVVQRRLPMLIHVNRASDILSVLRFARRERIELVLVGAAEGWLVAEAIAKAKVPVILGAMNNAPASFEQRNARSDNAVLLAKAGVKVALTTAATHNVGTLRFHLGNAVRAGLPHELALRAGTLSPAEIFGRARQLGALEPRRLANVVVWTGDPFEPSSYAETVIIRGEVQPVSNRQTALRDKYKAKLGL